MGNIYVLSKNKKNINFVHLNISIFTAFKNLCIMHGNVCVMYSMKSDSIPLLSRDLYLPFFFPKRLIAIPSSISLLDPCMLV